MKNKRKSIKMTINKRQETKVLRVNQEMQVFFMRKKRIQPQRLRQM